MAIGDGGNTVEGTAGGDLVFRFTLDPVTGAFSFFLFQPLDHQDPNNTGANDTIDVSFTIAVAFIDGTTQQTQIIASILDAGPTAGDVVVFDSYKSNTSFELNLMLLPTLDDTTAPMDAGADLFDGIEVIDITGSQSAEMNALTVSARDIFEVTDGGNLLIVLGDNDTLVLADGDAWTDTGDTRSITVGGTTETFDVWVADFADTQVTLLVDDDLTVQLETALA